MSAPVSFRPRASLRAVLRGDARLVGARVALGAPSGWVSPIEARSMLGLLYEDPAAAERAYLSERPSRFRDALALARTLIARLVTPSSARDAPARPWIVAARVDNVTAPHALAWALEPWGGDRARMAHFVHPHALNVAARDRTLRANLARADLVLPDGVGLRVAAALLGLRLAQNVNGTDLLPMLCAGCASRGIPLALVGGAPGVARDCAARLVAAHPALRVGPVEHGFVDERGARAFVARVRAAGPCIVLVGMGTPVQESWAWRWLADVPGVTVLTVGGLFDFFSGRVTRAPRGLRDAGLEWAWRLYCEPRRLARRYVLGNPLFLARALAQRACGP